ncbi:MAG: hypothetical protein EOM24_21460, partial [Chloroflexia bacterium]|nr:hypothetical protein [Chloroflexia bacterium]
MHRYANENIPLPVVEVLRQLGHHVLTTFESGQAGIALPDEDVLAFATQEHRVLITINRKHFIRLHRTSTTHAGIVVCTFDLDYVGLAQRIHDALAAHHDMNGQL